MAFNCSLEYRHLRHLIAADNPDRPALAALVSLECLNCNSEWLAVLVLILVGAKIPRNVNKVVDRCILSVSKS